MTKIQSLLVISILFITFIAAVISSMYPLFSYRDPSVQAELDEINAILSED